MKKTNRKPSVYTVYVIEFSADILTRRRFREANPGYTYDPAHPPVYVGYSVLTPEERFEQHRHGTKASRYTRHHVIRLRMDLADGLVFPTHDQAERMEKQHALLLRARGHGVWKN
jgi:predicted GIY-YIG superfamily endonuclease